jgi:malate synthase
MAERIKVAGLQVDNSIYSLVNNDIIPGTSLDISAFWESFADIVSRFSPLNKRLLVRRDLLQQEIDCWHQKNFNQFFDFSSYKKFLQEIGYLVPVGPDFNINTKGVDPEITSQAGPQLVVPVMNARFALNAANARWGSLYDSLYGTNVIAEENHAQKTKQYNPERGAKVVQYGKEFLDRSIPLAGGSHINVTKYFLHDGVLQVELEDGIVTGLLDPSQFCGYAGESELPEILLFKNNGLHFEIQVDSNTEIGRSDPAGVKDILIEAALTTIMDCEDSVAAVDAEDKALIYRNWLGLMKGDLEETLTKNGKTLIRRMNPDRTYKQFNGEPLILSGRSLLFVRNVGHLMTNPAILDSKGNEVPEGIMDAVITSLIGMHDIQGRGAFCNSKTGSIYIVKPKMHGPEEVAFTNDLFDAVEDALSLDRNTLKVGIMDEERRTSVNLKECIRAVRDRVVFINTGFLDRTGDEIHTSMEAGAFAPKGQLKTMPWISAYEDQNVDVGLACGLAGKAQIGKGMWAVPENMADMMQQKINHPLAGANTAWVPSPTAAVLHALHYHDVDVFAQQKLLSKRPAANIDDILTIPLLEEELSSDKIEKELENNAQGILGYVVRWIDQGVGCSKVPDINNVGLMEDRATLRISSQHITNWIRHGVTTEPQVLEVMKRMAQVVDQQNASDPLYQKMSPGFEQNTAFSAAYDLVVKGAKQPSGYTEPLLHAYRKKSKILSLASISTAELEE